VRITVGDITIDAFEESKFCLDGGAMFGIIPKTFWEQETSSDEKNRITLSANILLIQGENYKVLIEQGLGDKYTSKEIEIYNIRSIKKQFDFLKEQNISPNDITHVILTHLHFDHSGASTYENESHEIVPSFPNARYFIQRSQFEEASNPHERNKGSYKAETFMPVVKSGQMIFLDRGSEIVPGISTLVTHGHAMGHQVIEIDIYDFKAVYIGDLIPTANHVNLPWIMGYDLYPSETLEMKKKLLPRYAAEKRLMFFPHETRFFSGYVLYDEKRDRYRIRKYD